MDAKTKSSIINALRQHSMRWKPRYEAKKACQVGPALFKCSLCPTAIYEGKKELKLIELDFYSRTGLSHIILLKGKFEMDHNPPCIPVKGFNSGTLIISKNRNYYFDWNIYLDRMFCSKENFRGLCKKCHSNITYNKE